MVFATIQGNRQKRGTVMFTCIHWTMRTHDETMKLAEASTESGTPEKRVKGCSMLFLLTLLMVLYPNTCTACPLQRCLCWRICYLTVVGKLSLFVNNVKFTSINRDLRLAFNPPNVVNISTRFWVTFNVLLLLVVCALFQCVSVHSYELSTVVHLDNAVSWCVQSS